MLHLYKRYFKLQLLSLVVLSSLIVACSSQPELTKLPTDTVILAFGDSLTYGTGAEADEAYPAILAGLSGFEVVNAGVPGEVTAKGSARLPKVLEDVKPELIIICHGGNDLIRKTGEKATADNLRIMVDLAQQQGVSVVIIAVPKPGIFLSEPEFYAQIAEEYKVPLIEGLLPAILRKNSLKSDVIHPNAAGYKMMGKAVFKVLKQVGAL